MLQSSWVEKFEVVIKGLKADHRIHNESNERSMPETVKGDWPHNSGVFICGAGLAIARPISFHGLLSMAQNIDLQRSFKAIES